MSHDTPSFKLAEEIKKLELKQTEELVLLKAQLHITSHELKPVNIIKNAVMDFLQSPGENDNHKSVIGFTTESLIQKATTGSFVSRLLKSVAQAVISNIVSSKR
jgi:hypothetical protein